MESQYPDVSLEQIDHTVLREYVSGLKENHSPGGVNHHIKVLKILFKFMVEEGVIGENPSKKISRVKTEQAVIPTFSNNQIMAMLEVTKHQMDFPGIRNYALITLLYDTGCRISELLGLKIDDIQLEEKIDIWIPKMSGGKKLDKSIRNWQDFIALRKIRDHISIHPKATVCGIKFNEFANKVNLFRTGIAGILIQLHMLFKEPVAAKIIRSSFSPEVEVIKEENSQ